MDEFKDSLRSLTSVVCRQVNDWEFPTGPIRTVDTSNTPPNVAIDPSRPDLSSLRFSLTIGLLRIPEYDAAATAVENEPLLQDGILVGPGGVLLKPEKTNITRALLTNFLWRYLRDGKLLDWSEARFEETFQELQQEFGHMSVVSHTRLPLSNIRMGIDSLDLTENMKLEPATIEELDRWLNPDRRLPPIGEGPPNWNTQHVDRPAVLHVRGTVVSRPASTDVHAAVAELPMTNVDPAVAALRLVTGTPISVLFQEHDDEGMLAYSGRGTSWGRSPSTLGTTVTLDSDVSERVIYVYRLLLDSPNVDRLRIPISRWESSLTRINLEDKLIDAWIGLEALLLAGMEGELTYRASLRLAEFLGTDGATRKEIYHDTKLSYAWRSIIVHGLSSKRIARRQ